MAFTAYGNDLLRLYEMRPGFFHTRNGFFLIIGCLLCVLGVICLFTSPIVINYIVSRELILSPTSRSYEVWKSNPLPMNLDFYFFNWTNPQDIYNDSTKPKLEQRGPYRFKETKEKVDVVWNDNNTVSFRQLRRWYFDKEYSNGSLDDNITTLNVIPLTAAFQVRYWSGFFQKGLSFSLSGLGTKIHVTHTAGEFLFDGYEDRLINMASSMPAFAGVEIPPFDRFGWFYMRNGSTDFDGVFNMATGKGKQTIGEALRWNYMKQTPYFKGHCGLVHGSAGEFWSSHRTRNSIGLFSPDLCRYIEYDYEEDSLVKGIRGYKYSGGKSMVDNGTLIPENTCYCSGECMPSGVMNVSACRYGSPSFASFPHFYHADPIYTNQVEGLHPDESKHKFFITLEPKTGIPLEVAAKFQINVLLQPSDYISLYKNVPRMLFPMIWFEQHVTISEGMASELRQLLNLPHIASIISFIMIGLGVAIALMVGVTPLINNMIKKCRSQKKRDMPSEYLQNVPEMQPMMVSKATSTKM